MNSSVNYLFLIKA